MSKPSTQPVTYDLVRFLSVRTAFSCSSSQYRAFSNDNTLRLTASEPRPRQLMYYLYIRVAVSVALSCYASIYRGFCNLYFTIFNKKKRPNRCAFSCCMSLFFLLSENDGAKKRKDDCASLGALGVFLFYCRCVYVVNEVWQFYRQIVFDVDLSKRSVIGFCQDF